MARPIRALFAAGLAAAINIPGLAGSASAAEPPIAAVSSSNPISAQEAKDGEVVRTVLAAYVRGGFAAETPYLPALREVLDRAPASYPAVEVRGDDTIVRTDILSPVQDMTVLLQAAAQSAGKKKGRTFVTQNVYPIAAFLLGSYANEMKRYNEAIAFLDRGLALQPNKPILVIERGSALTALHRPAEAVAGYDAALAANPALSDADRARLLRNRGSALTDLRRFDEAQASLSESLRLAPGNPLTLHELHYLAQVRGGAPTVGVKLETPAEQALSLKGETQQAQPPTPQTPH